MRGLKGRVFIVAGGANGIGAAIVARLADEGAAVLVGDLNETALRATVARLRDKGGDVEGLAFDMADEASIETLVARAIAWKGKLNGLAITVADLSVVTLGHDVEVARMDAAIWERTLRVNLIGSGLLMRAVLPHLKAVGGGAIVSTSSSSAFMGSHEMPAYAASKSGLHALVRHTARVGGPDKIRCNGIAPGLVLTPGARVNLTPETELRALGELMLPRLGEPEDLASAYAFLLSDDSSWMTGQIIAVNGGSHMRD